jgi:hypothetical protein
MGMALLVLVHGLRKLSRPVHRSESGSREGKEDGKTSIFYRLSDSIVYYRKPSTCCDFSSSKRFLGRSLAEGWTIIFSNITVVKP